MNYIFGLLFLISLVAHFTLPFFTAVYLFGSTIAHDKKFKRQLEIRILISAILIPVPYILVIFFF